MSDIVCDCRGPGTHINGQCAVMVEVRFRAELQRRMGVVAGLLQGQRWKWGDAAHTAARVQAKATVDDLEELQRQHGLVPYREQLRQRGEERARSDDPKDLESRMQRAGVPWRALSALRALEDWPAVDAAKKWLAMPGEWVNFLALMGDTGLGKTVAAAYAFREQARRTSPDLQTGQAEPLVWLQAQVFTRISAFSDDDRRTMERAKAARFLVLDELGDEATAMGVAAVKELCMAREAAGRRTVITTNLRGGTGDSFELRYGAALWDRLTTRGVVPKLTGPSRRRREP